jgi:hypothetical protein
MLLTCSKCKQEKPTTEYYADPKAKRGFQYQCKSCCKVTRNNYCERNYERYYQNQTDSRNKFQGRMKECFFNARSRAKRKGMEFNLSCDDLIVVWDRQNGKCAITGIEMQLIQASRKKANPARVSVDRIDSNKGYTIDNIQMVCWVVNQMKGDRTEAEFRFWIDALYVALRQSAAKGLEQSGSRFNDYPEREYTSSDVEAPRPLFPIGDMI